MEKIYLKKNILEVISNNDLPSYRMQVKQVLISLFWVCLGEVMGVEKSKSSGILRPGLEMQQWSVWSNGFLELSKYSWDTSREVWPWYQNEK